ncbi:MAG: hypothetical protein DRI26_00770 [Chloroflexi bacterium]|nr:MAG: hypothetical protein DRI26_00770 [Chloroflexota bacterium]
MNVAEVAAELYTMIRRLEKMEALLRASCPHRRQDQRGEAVCLKLDGSVGLCRPGVCPLLGEKKRDEWAGNL